MEGGGAMSALLPGDGAVLGPSKGSDFEGFSKFVLG